MRCANHGFRAAFLVAISMTAACQIGTLRSAAQPYESLTVATPFPPPVAELRKSFRTQYDAAIGAHRLKLRSSYPIITQDLLNMTLLRAGGPPSRFSMKSGTYSLMAHSAHPPLTVYSILSVHGFGDLSDEAVKQLTEYRATLRNAAETISAMPLPPATTTRLTTILSSTEQFVINSIARRSATEAAFAAYVRPLRGLIEENFRTGAHEQLVQFRDQVNLWRREFPEEKWAELRVVVLGFHQARELYALKAYFQWLLQEPEHENGVVYAEFQSPISGEYREAAETKALETLTKVDFDKGAGKLIFGDSIILQRDVMGPAALKILMEWGESEWP